MHTDIESIFFFFPVIKIYTVLCFKFTLRRKYTDYNTNNFTANFYNFRLIFDPADILRIITFFCGITIRFQATIHRG